MPAFAETAAQWQGCADACAEVAGMIRTLTHEEHLEVAECDHDKQDIAPR
jgi:hypothetical protein